MKLRKRNFWILKEHNNFSYLWKFEPDIPNSFREILFTNPKIYKECMPSLTFCHPVIFQFLRAHAWPPSIWWILTWLRGFLVIFLYLVWVFFLLKSLLGIARQWSRQKLAILTLKPRSHVRVLNIESSPIWGSDFFPEFPVNAKRIMLLYHR